MTTNNTQYVANWREKKGTELHNAKYKMLREKYVVPSTQACKMKYWSDNRIKGWLVQHGYIEVGDL